MGAQNKEDNFFLSVDDFGIKYYSKADTDYLLQAIGNHYRYTIDWDGTHCCGLTFQWNYTKGYVNIYMPGYVEKNN